MEQLETLLSNIRVNAHSSIRIEAAGKVIYLDPFRLEEEVHDADLIFVTHDHYDHFSPEDIGKTVKPQTVFVMPKSTREAAGAVIEGHPVVTAEPGENGIADGIFFEAVPAYNPRKLFHPKKNGWVGYVLTLEGLRVYFAGDTDATAEAAAVRCDIALLPIGGKYTMDAREAAALAEQLRPKAVIPVHYGSIVGKADDFRTFTEALDPTIRVVKKIG